jgi:hypothetical protein
MPATGIDAHHEPRAALSLRAVSEDHHSGLALPSAFYLLHVGLIGLAAVLTMKETKGSYLCGDQDAETTSNLPAPTDGTRAAPQKTTH